MKGTRSLSAVMGAVALMLCVTLRAQQHLTPPHEARQSLSGVIRVTGNAQLSALVQRWEQGFTSRQPSVRFHTHMAGSDVAMAALYTGKADLALLGRDSTDSETKAFEWVFGYPPLQVQILRGSLDRAGRSPALVVFVHRDNPLAKITFAQLAAVFEHQPPPPTTAIQTWSQLGLQGEWANQPINVYMDDTESGTGRFFRHAVLADARLLNWDHVTEYRDDVRPDGSVEHSRQQILDALAHDRFGLAVSSLPSVDGVKTVAVVGSDGDPYEATRATLAADRYPLSRAIYAYLNRPPQRPVDPKVAEFLRYILSSDGQKLVRPGDGYMPMPEEQLRAQRKEF
jgi:phosphate transport system substrate-binding protein